MEASISNLYDHDCILLLAAIEEPSICVIHSMKIETRDQMVDIDTNIMGCNWITTQLQQNTFRVHNRDNEYDKHHRDNYPRSVQVCPTELKVLLSVGL